jgi:hypothetical protein
MTEHALRDRRKLAAPYATAAWRAGDVHSRVSLTSAPKRCYDAGRTEERGGLREVWDATFYDHVIQKKIGQHLREEFAVQKELPYRFLTLLMQLNPQPDGLSAREDDSAAKGALKAKARG